jgi:alanyl-tRNA synthetase
VKILGESGVAAGVRRLEALTGEAALKYFREQERKIEDVAVILKTSTNDVLRKAEAIVFDLKAAEKEIEALRSKLISSAAEDVLSKAIEVGGVKVVTARFDHLDLEGLRNTGDMLKNKMGSGVVVLASAYGDKVSFIVTATKDVLTKGVHSGNIIREVSKIAGGGGGGRPDMAQAGGKDVSKINDALKSATKIVEAQLV